MAPSPVNEAQGFYIDPVFRLGEAFVEAVAVGPAAGPAVVEDELRPLCVVGDEGDEVAWLAQAHLERSAVAQVGPRLVVGQFAGELAGFSEHFPYCEGIPLSHFVAGQAFRIEARPGLAEGGEIRGVVEKGREHVFGLGSVAAWAAHADVVAE